MRRLAFIAALVAAVAAACSEPPPPATPYTPAPTAPAAPELPTRAISLKDAGLDAASMDKSANACTDFYQLACGTMLKNTEIPGEEAAWGPAYELQRHTEEFLRDTLEKAAKAPGDDPVAKKLGAFYGACMNEGAAEQAGVKPLKPLFAVVEKVRDRKTLYAAITELHKHRIWPLFDASSQQDFKDATLVIAGLDQDGLGLPDRDYYLDQDPKTKEHRAFYEAHVERMFALAGDSAASAKKKAADVMRIETAAAKLAQDKVVRRDPYKVYNKVDRKGLAAAAPGFAWDAYFAGLGFPDVKDVSINSVEYFKGIDALMTAEKPDAWQSYLRWKVLESQGSRLSRAFVDERFKLRRDLTGQKELTVRWKRCVRATDASLGELLAQ
ncbi:MAG TPA: M13 family metallopeptidase N-terminal domain-containing protein, partial [Byssovorax sp.]